MKHNQDLIAKNEELLARDSILYSRLQSSNYQTYQTNNTIDPNQSYEETSFMSTRFKSIYPTIMSEDSLAQNFHKPFQKDHHLGSNPIPQAKNIGEYRVSEPNKQSPLKIPFFPKKSPRFNETCFLSTGGHTFETYDSSLRDRGDIIKDKLHYHHLNQLNLIKVDHNSKKKCNEFLNEILDKKTIIKNSVPNTSIVIKTRSISTPKENKIIDLHGIIGSKLLKPPEIYITKNIEEVKRKPPKVIKDYTQLNNYDKYIPSTLVAMNKIDGSIDGYFGDWNRDEFLLTRSKNKANNYNRKQKFYSSIVTKLHEDGLITNNHIKPKKLDLHNNSVNIFEKKIVKKRRGILHHKNHSSKEEKDKQGLSLDSERKEALNKSEDNIPQDNGEFLQFPILDLGKKKYGGIEESPRKIDKPFAKQLLDPIQRKRQRYSGLKINFYLRKANGIASHYEQINIMLKWLYQQVSVLNDEITPSIFVIQNLKIIGLIYDDEFNMHEIHPQQIRTSTASSRYSVKEKYDDRRFMQVLKYISGTDAGILNNRTDIQSPNAITFEQKFNTSTNFSSIEYQKLSQIVYTHDVFDEVHGHLKNFHKGPLPYIRNIQDKYFILIGYHINENMAIELGNALAKKNKLVQIIMVDNKMKDEVGEKFFLSIGYNNQKLEILRYVKNHIDSRLTQVWKDIFFSESLNVVRLKEFTIDFCKINTENFVILFDKASKHKYIIRYLGLSGLCLNGESINALSRYLAENDFLYSIDISFNNIPRKSMETILKMALINLNLRFLNLEKNQIGCSNDQENVSSACSKSFQDHKEDKSTPAENMNEIIILLHSSFKGLSSLIHVNLSDTELKSEELEYLCSGIKLSVSLMSVHLSQDIITPDLRAKLSKILNAKADINLGDKSPKSKDSCSNHDITSALIFPNSSAVSLIYYRIIDPNINMSYDSWRESNSCWICNRWNKVHITYQLDKESIKDEYHQDEQNFFNTASQWNSQGEFNIEIQELLSMIDDANERLLHDGLLQETGQKLQYMIKFKSENGFMNNVRENIYYDYDTGLLDYFAYLPPKQYKYQILKLVANSMEVVTILENNLVVKPRETEIKAYLVKVPDNNQVFHKKFHFSKSVFKEFREENDGLDEKCFQNDWNSSKLAKVIKRAGEIVKFKAHLLQNYKKLRLIFLFNISKSTSYPNITLESFLQFCQEIGAYDEYVTRQSVEKAFIATNISEKFDRYNNNPDKELCRYEFLEILIRIAIIKYYDSKICQNPSEAWGKNLLLKMRIYYIFENRKIFQCKFGKCSIK